MIVSFGLVSICWLHDAQVSKLGASLAKETHWQLIASQCYYKQGIIFWIWPGSFKLNTTLVEHNIIWSSKENQSKQTFTMIVYSAEAPYPDVDTINKSEL